MGITFFLEPEVRASDKFAELRRSWSSTQSESYLGYHIEDTELINAFLFLTQGRILTHKSQIQDATGLWYQEQCLRRDMKEEDQEIFWLFSFGDIRKWCGMLKRVLDKNSKTEVYPFG